MFQFQCPSLQTLRRNQFSSATLILITSLQHLSELCSVWHRKQSIAQLKLLFLDMGTTIKYKLGSILEKLIQRHNRREQVTKILTCIKMIDNVNCASTQFLKIQKNQIFDLQESLEQSCKVLPVFRFNSA